MKSLSLVIPTYNRPKQLACTLESLKIAIIPNNLSIVVYIVDNNSTQENSSEYKDLANKYNFFFKVHYAFEAKQGRSFALNTGVSLSKEDFIGFIDDDEKIDKSWFEIVEKHICTGNIDYLGGPCKPDWQCQPPVWLPAHIGQYQGILGWIEQSETIISFDNFDGELCGGNCIIRRDSINEVGGFDTRLGRSSKNLMGGEDGELHRRLKDFKKYGIYDPNLIIYHHISQERMTFRYHLRWAFWSGASNGIRIKNNKDTKEDVPHLFGIPRYWFSKAMVGIVQFSQQLISFDVRKHPKGICGAMDFAYFLGFFYGRHFF